MLSLGTHHLVQSHLYLADFAQASRTPVCCGWPDVSPLTTEELLSLLSLAYFAGGLMQRCDLKLQVLPHDTCTFFRHWQQVASSKSAQSQNVSEYMK